MGRSEPGWDNSPVSWSRSLSRTAPEWNSCLKAVRCCASSSATVRGPMRSSSEGSISFAPIRRPDRLFAFSHADSCPSPFSVRRVAAALPGDRPAELPPGSPGSPESPVKRIRPHGRAFRRKSRPVLHVFESLPSSFRSCDFLAFQTSCTRGSHGASRRSKFLHLVANVLGSGRR